MQFRSSPCLFLFTLLSLWITSPVLTAAAVTPERDKSFSKYVEIPGASRVGTDTCTTCHADTAKNFQHAFHKQQGLE